MADQVVYTSNVRIERIKGPLRRAHLPQREEPVFFGVHSEIAEHYGVDPQIHAPQQPTTLDHVYARLDTVSNTSLSGIATEARGRIRLFEGNGLVLTDDRAPVEYLTHLVILRYMLEGE